MVPVFPFESMVCLLLVNGFSGSKDSNFEPMWSDLELDYSIAAMLLVIRKKICTFIRRVKRGSDIFRSYYSNLGI